MCITYIILCISPSLCGVKLVLRQCIESSVIPRIQESRLLSTPHIKFLQHFAKSIFRSFPQDARYVFLPERGGVTLALKRDSQPQFVPLEAVLIQC